MGALYDALNGWGPDYDYWLALADRIGPGSLTDLGCGTGQLTVLLARQGARAVLGVDPDPAMLSVARARDGSERVTWVQGYAADVPSASSDLVVMTSHVAQVLLADEEWLDALRHVHRALRPGGRLAFDTRNPVAHGWEAWNPRDSLRHVETDDGAFEVWHEVTGVGDGLVTFHTTTRHVASGVESKETDVLRFRSEDALRDSLASTGFRVEHVHGDWDGTDATQRSHELIVCAQAEGG